MIETFKKWFGKKEEEKEPEPTYDYLFIVSLKDGEYLEGISHNWENPNRASDRLISILRGQTWFYLETPSGERVLINGIDVDRITVIPEPIKE